VTTGRQEDRAAGLLWSITSYFNSAGLPSRRDNYRRFRRQMASPLLTVELTHGDEPFALARDDADILVQLRGGDVVWQKERLLDLALARLPESCRYVAWIDCDVVFARPDWPELALLALERSRLVQLFEAVHYLRRDVGDRPPDVADTYATRVAIAAAAARGGQPKDLLADGDRQAFGWTSPGFAWAMPRETIERCGFFDSCIIGGGDRAMIAAAYGDCDLVIARQKMTEPHAEAYRKWSAAFREAVGGEVGSIPGDLFHYWHGSVEKRRMRERYDEITPFAFDPNCDIGRAACGAWQWTSNKPGLHEIVSRQFFTRYEDA
jgi:hypothetical protein